jgi:hypothetical protein
MWTVLIKSLAAIVAGVFGPKRAGDRWPADANRAQLGQPHPPFSEPLRSADFSMTLWIWRLILASVDFVVPVALLFSALDGFGELGLRGKGLVALTLEFLFTTGCSSSSATKAAAMTRPIGRPRATRDGAVFP